VASIDLTPFGFTPTESLAYEALLALGPSSGYAVAKHLAVARANGYQALNGLVSKGAALLIDENPQRFRAVKPDALLAQVTATEAAKVGQLERQVAERGALGDEAIVRLEDQRSLRAVLTRWAGRSPGEILCIAPRRLRDALQPVWRKREADGAPTRLWTAEDVLPAATPHTPSLLFWCAEAAVVAQGDSDGRGYWCSDPLLLATVRTAILGVISQPVG
jgi:hypothetical protein